MVLEVKNLPLNVEDIRDAGSILGSGRSLGGRNGKSLLYSCLGKPMDRGDTKLQSVRSQRVRHDRRDVGCMHKK